MFQKKVHYVSQLGSMDCGIACLTMILNYYGCKSDIVDIGAEIQIGRDGMTLAQMKELAEKYGFKFAAYQYNHEEKNLIEYLPAILCNDSHYVVVDKTKKKGKYILFDPANGKRVVDFLELKNGYKDILVSVIPSRNIKKIKKTKFKIEVKFSQFMIAIMLMLMCQLITLAVPMVVQKVIDSLSSAHITIHIWKITLLVLLIMCAHFVLSLLRQKILLNINMKLFKTMISNMIHKIFRLDVSFFEWHSAGDIGNRFNSINQLNDILTNGFINIIIQGITSLVCLAVIRSMSKEQIYKWFSVVTQNPMCLNASIRKNIDIIGDAPDEKIWKVLDIVALKEEVLSMPLGLDTLVGEGGQNISGGQKQRIAIARALLSDTEVVIFDEATSNLDQLTEKKIYDNLRSTNKTQIIITHRLSSIRDTDYIYVLNRGSIIEQGTHLDLMKKKGWYFESIQ